MKRLRVGFQQKHPRGAAAQLQPVGIRRSGSGLPPQDVGPDPAGLAPQRDEAEHQLHQHVRLLLDELARERLPPGVL